MIRKIVTAKLRPAAEIVKVVREPGGRATTPRLADAHALFDAAMEAMVRSHGRIVLEDDGTEHGQLMNAAKFAWLMAPRGALVDDRRGRPRSGMDVALNMMRDLVVGGLRRHAAAKQVVAAGRYAGQGGRTDRRHEALVRRYNKLYPRDPP